MSTTATNEETKFLKLADGVELPILTCSSPLDIVVGHGLGSLPSEKHYFNDIAYDLWTSALQNLPHHATASHNGTCVFYTARGHGESRGWKDCPLTSFEWPNLAKDMLEVANSTFQDGSTSKFVSLGQSMGAASALYMTISNPNRVAGLVLVRPPRAWQARQRISPVFLEAAKEIEKQLPGTFWHLPILAAATTDLPTTGYDKITCPVLILCHGQDEAHPIETGKILKEYLPHSRLELASNEEEARRVWPDIIAKWLVENSLITD